MQYSHCWIMMLEQTNVQRSLLAAVPAVDRYTSQNSRGIGRLAHLMPEAAHMLQIMHAQFVFAICTHMYRPQLQWQPAAPAYNRGMIGVHAA